ncbi:hypothetical protein HNR46_001341 [Haloferula luteola]|uniref:Uncharacterized protein n=1 Tax=Haloferula luteola TaxID=595692 RepID=A0A840UY82_9BACT|nr:hypothetical protein [Haloferula luteola]MBB5351107.1 hypothetical protein [Haloferula luteola]
MAFETNIPGHILIGDENVIFGTCALGDTFGEIMSFDLTRTADLQEIENCVGGLKAAILSKPRFEMEIETLFDDSITLPELGGAITLPLAGLVARITGDIKVGWTNNGSRKLSFKASHWDSMAEETSPGSGIYENKAFKVALDGTTTAIS